ncbi:MBL fold metallo-hydrolase [uncultured Sulfitobacter sp.]|uniref:MBL fold metallo-hydrolase n=1 Tax=uncultured Sulfitobacter sp. TaxID=191468 RepID=UPI002632DDC9|nr:MBL fold metallo-hydrolase [uncultured Sulfitobacter sp.]
MRLPRRNFMSGAAALGFGAAYGLQLRPAHAQLALGDIKLDVVSDGSLTLPGSFIFEPMPQDELLPILKRLGQSAEVLTPPCNVTLMRQGDRTVLFDAGSGSDFSPNSGILLDSLDALDVSAEDITDIVFTHAHPDHLWGILDDFDDPLFTNAKYMIGKTEWDYWLNPNTVDEIGDARTAFAVGAKRRLEMIEDQIEFFNDGDEIMAGVVARATLGHTPGHMAIEVRQGSESVMILGDCIGNDHIAFARPEWLSGSDQDPETAAATRLSLMDQLSHEKTRVIGFHLTDNGLGYVEKATDGYAFVTET